MNNARNYLFIGLSALVFSSCGIQIAGQKIPYNAACGSLGKYKCRAQGVGERLGSDSTIIFKERVNLAGTKEFNLGRSYFSAYNTKYVFNLNSLDIVKEENQINADFTSKTIKKLKADLRGELKKAEYSAEAQAQILNNFHSEVNDKLKIKAKYHVYTLKQNLLDQIDLYKEEGASSFGEHYPLDPRVPGIVDRLKRHKKPLVRQVLAIYEEVDYEGNSNLTNILQASITKSTQASDQNKANILIDGMLSIERNSQISASSKLTSVYSYGLFKRSWFIPNEE